MTGTENAQRLAAKLETSGQATLDFFKTIRADQWDVQVYSDGPAWNVRQIFTHIVEVEDSIPRLVRQIVEGGAGVPEGFDIDGYNQEHVAAMSQLSPQELLAEFPRRREQTIELVAGMGEADLDKQGRHPYLGISETREMIRLLMLHHRLHQRDISKALE